MSNNYSKNLAKPSVKKPISPRRKRQRLGGSLIIAWAIFSLIEGIGKILDDPSQSTWVYVSITVVFCLFGGLFIYLSFRVDPEFEEALKQQAEEEGEEEPLLFDDVEEEEEEDPKRKYLE